MGLCNFLLIVISLVVEHVSCQVFWYQPEQIHLAYGDNTSVIVVTWSTMSDTKESVVEYGINGLVLRATGSSRIFVDGGPKKHSQYIHKVTLNKLTPDSKYGKLSIIIVGENGRLVRTVVFFFVRGYIISRCQHAQDMRKGKRLSVCKLKFLL